MGQFEPSKELRGRILSTIALDERRLARKYLLGSAATLIASGVGVVVSVRAVIAAAAESSLYHYASLLFSDSDIVLSYWKTFAFSLVEAVPFFALTAVFAMLLVGMASLYWCITHTRRGFTFSFTT